MKKILALAALLLAGMAGMAQCDKPSVLTSSKTEYLDANMNLQNTEDEKSTVEIDTTTVLIAPGNGDQKMTINITSRDCNWKTAYKEGKSVIKGTMTEPDGSTTHNVTITIEGKEGKLTLLAELEDMPDRKIRVPIDTFAEKKS